MNSKSFNNIFNFYHMKKKTNNLARAAMMLLLAVLSSVGAWAEDVVTVGTAQWSLGYVPIDLSWNYSASQQIYTNDEVGGAKQITAIAFNTTKGGYTRTIDVYMTHTSKSSFDSNQDLVPVTTTDLVFSGSFTFAANQWNVIELDEPFAYNGTQNLLITIKDNTGKSAGWDVLSHYGFSASSQAITAHSDDSDIDPTTMVLAENAYSSYANSKNQIKIYSAAYPTPVRLAAVEITDVSAQIQCTLRGGATAWNLRYRKVGTEDWTPLNNLTERSKTIENLESAIQYEAQVQAVFTGGNTSDWTESLVFATSCCPIEQQTELMYSLNSYNGWKNFAVQIVDAETGIEMALLRSPSYGLTQGTVTLCCGRTYNANWIYDQDNSTYNSQLRFSLLFQPGDEFYTMDYGEAPEENAELTTFVMECGDYCAPMPKNVSIDDVFHDGALLSFTTNTAGGVIAYSTDANFDPATAANKVTVTFDADGHGITDGGSGTGSYRLTGLEPQTDYYVAIQSVCTAQPYDDGGHSRWTTPVKLTTGAEEAPVDNIKVLNEGSTTTQIGWSSMGKESKHNVYIRQQTGAGTAVTNSQIQSFNLNGEGAGFTTWNGTGGGWKSTAFSDFDNILAEVSKWFVVTNVPADAVLKVKTKEGDSYKAKTNTRGKTTEVFSAGAEKQTATGDALNEEILTKITGLNNSRKSGKSLTKNQWMEKYFQYKNKRTEWELAESGSAQEKALAEELKSLRRELGLDKRNIKKAAHHGISAGYKAYKNARKSKTGKRASDTDPEQYFVWINHEEGDGYFVVSDLEIVTSENMGEWTAYSDVTGNTFTFENLTPGTTYEVMIEPVYDDGTTGPEASIMFTTYTEVADPSEQAFSVSDDGKKVKFAKGNLRYSLDYNYDAHWSFAEHQYDVYGTDNLETQELNDYGNRFPSTDHLDLFCWSAGYSNNGATHTYPDDSYYTGDFEDWGTLPELTEEYGTGWYTLTKDEWTYLLSGRENAASLRAFATVNDVKGLVILPDAWAQPAGVTAGNTYTAEQWTVMEEAGAVFLPAAGNLTVSFADSKTVATVNDLNVMGSYWSSTLSGDKSDINAFAMSFNDPTITPAADTYRRIGSAVRLAKCIQLPVMTAASGYTTLVSTETLDFSNVEGLTAYIATNVDNASDVVTLKRIGVVPANTPIVVKGAPSTTYIVPTTITTAGQPEGNLLRGSATKSKELATGTAYILSDGKFCKNAAGTMPAGKAYLPAGTLTNGARMLTIVIDGDATAILSIDVEETPSRTGIYNLQGQRVKTPGKGLYIINGKKVIIK